MFDHFPCEIKNESVRSHRSPAVLPPESIGLEAGLVAKHDLFSGQQLSPQLNCLARAICFSSFPLWELAWQPSFWKGEKGSSSKSCGSAWLPGVARLGSDSSASWHGELGPSSEVSSSGWGCSGWWWALFRFLFLVQYQVRRALAGMGQHRPQGGLWGLKLLHNCLERNPCFPHLNSPLFFSGEKWFQPSRRCEHVWQVTNQHCL